MSENDLMTRPQSNIGPIVVGVLVNTYLFGAVTGQYLTYFSHKWNDPLWIKASVLIMCLTDAFYSTAVIQAVWELCVSSIDNPALLGTPKWPLVFTPVTTGISSFLTHNVMGYRIYRLTNRPYFYFAILAISVVPCMFGIGLSVGHWIMLSQHRWLNIPHSVYLAFEMWMVLQGVADVITTSALAWLFYNSRTGQVRTDLVLRRLIRSVAQTGFLALLFWMGCLILTSTEGDTKFAALFAIPIGRVYSATLLDTLVVRPALRNHLMQHVDFMRQSPSHCIWFGDQEIVARDSKEGNANKQCIGLTTASQPSADDGARIHGDPRQSMNVLPQDSEKQYENHVRSTELY